jgi:hypothetical protein
MSDCINDGLSAVNRDLFLHKVPLHSSIMSYFNGLIEGVEVGYHYF